MNFLFSASASSWFRWCCHHSSSASPTQGFTGGNFSHDSDDDDGDVGDDGDGDGDDDDGHGDDDGVAIIHTQPRPRRDLQVGTFFMIELAVHNGNKLGLRIYHCHISCFFCFNLPFTLLQRANVLLVRWKACILHTRDFSCVTLALERWNTKYVFWRKVHTNNLFFKKLKNNSLLTFHRATRKKHIICVF